MLILYSLLIGLGSSPNTFHLSFSGSYSCIVDDREPAVSTPPSITILLLSTEMMYRSKVGTDYMYIKVRMQELSNCDIMSNQRTNGPVNAHLKPEIYTNKLA